ncbi:hypothetical protein LguiA_015803 [Lonicera macranthoides]
MASSSLSSIIASSSLSSTLLFPLKSFKRSSSLSSLPVASFPHTLRAFTRKPKSVKYERRNPRFSSIKSQTLDFADFFDGEFEEEDDDSYDDPIVPVWTDTDFEEKEEPECPPGLRKYETMVVLRPDMSEDERITLTQKYEELLVSGGGMYVEVFNRGVIPLAYDIKKRNRAGEKNVYMHGIYLLFTYFTKPESPAVLEETLKMDDNVIRWSTFKIRKRKY